MEQRSDIITPDAELDRLGELRAPLVAPPADVDPADIAQMRRYANLTGFPMGCVDLATGAILATSAPGMLRCVPSALLSRLREFKDPGVVETSSGLLLGLLPLESIDAARLGAVAYALAAPDARPHEIVLAAAEQGWSAAQLDAWLSKQVHCSAALMRGILLSASMHDREQATEAELRADLDKLGEELEQSYEEITLIHSLANHLQISRAPEELAELCLDRIHGMVGAAGHLIWLEGKGVTRPRHQRGAVLFDDESLARLIARFENFDWSKPLVRNRVAETLLGADFPGLDSLLIVPIAEGTFRSGWIVSVNRDGGKEFGTVEAGLLKSVAAILGTHMRNVALFIEHEELLVSFVRSLVSTLDAKDPYTRGHSERVALIARRIGMALDLSPNELHDIYVSGLLHDIGKIGVDDAILRKPGSLTDDEFAKIQAHPAIGCGILEGLKNLQHVMPGVRHHHEMYSGRGYPDGLAGEQIPLMARIMAVADAYDAMTSDRPYRNGMPVEKVEAIFRKGAGDQWDARVIDAYFRVRHAIAALCNRPIDTAAPQDAGAAGR